MFGGRILSDSFESRDRETGLFQELLPALGVSRRDDAWIGNQQHTTPECSSMVPQGLDGARAVFQASRRVFGGPHHRTKGHAQ